MTFTKIEENIDEKLVKERKPLRLKLEEFINMNVKTVKVEFRDNEYSNPLYGYRSLFNAAKRHRLPIKVFYCDGACYLQRTDM